MVFCTVNSVVEGTQKGKLECDCRLSLFSLFV